MSNYTFYSSNKRWGFTFSVIKDDLENYRITEIAPQYISYYVNYYDPDAANEIPGHIREKIEKNTGRDIRDADNYSIPINNVIWEQIQEVAKNDFGALKNKLLTPAYKIKAEELGLDFRNL